MDIREISPFEPLTDQEAVKYIYQESFQHPYTWAMLEARLKTAERTWVYLINNEIVGYLVLEMGRTIPYLSQVATRVSARKKGVATGLMDHAVQYLKSQDWGIWYLQTDVSNPAQKLYFDHGFRVSGFERDFYGRGKHGIEMTEVF